MLGFDGAAPAQAQHLVRCRFAGIIRLGLDAELDAAIEELVKGERFSLDPPAKLSLLWTDLKTIEK
jgi:hypothetical protein